MFKFYSEEMNLTTVDIRPDIEPELRSRWSEYVNNI